MERIVLTECGETLVIEHPLVADDTQLPIGKGGIIGVHEHDGYQKGVVYAISVSPTHYVLLCSVCGRIGKQIPKEANTYAELDRWCGCVRTMAPVKLHPMIQRAIFIATAERPRSGVFQEEDGWVYAID